MPPGRRDLYFILVFSIVTSSQQKNVALAFLDQRVEFEDFWLHVNKLFHYLPANTVRVSFSSKQFQELLSS